MMKAATRRWRGVLLGLMASMSGCGGGSDGGDPPTPRDAGLGADVAVSADGSGGGEAGPGVDSGPADDAGSGDDGGATDAGIEMDASGTTDAGRRDGATPRDGGAAGVMCGMEICRGGQVCCATFGGGMTTAMCTDPDACRGASFACDGPEDCTDGTVCCGNRTGSGAGRTACASPDGCMFRICRTDEDCPSGSECCPFMRTGVCSAFGCARP
ncbi:MAG: hypothetical protein NZ898_09430 [Myxococcota bacterium]|nr:hypothetical protein [Myxococcota bacterium]